jgi:predicted porin
MQMKLIALAVAGLASTAAFAQTNVTIFGVVDYGYAFRFDNVKDNVNDLSSFNSGQASGSRLGFKGNEDLGNGLKAVFLIELGLGVDRSSNDSSAGSSSINATRNAYVGLAGNFGTLIGGRLYTPHYMLWRDTIDPFGAGTVGTYGNFLGGAAAGDVVRVDNAVAYVSPSFGGFTVTGAYSNKLAGQETVNTTTGTTNGDDTKIYALLGQFKAGGLNLGLNYHYGKFEGSTTLDNTYNITLGGLYNFGFMKLHGAVAFNETEFRDTAANDNIEIYNYFLGVTVPVGKIDLKGSIGFSDADQAGEQTQFAIGANYNLSKRTDLYAAYTYIDADDDRVVLAAATNALGLGGSFGAGDASSAGQGYQQGVQIGVRHKF